MPRTVMLIDDARSIRLLLRSALEHKGYEVLEAADGEAAMELLDGRKVDAVVCDLNMPRMDGLAFLNWLRHHPAYKRVPVAVLTTETRPEVKAAVRHGGATAYINKPCTPSVFVDVVNRLCA